MIFESLASVFLVELIQKYGLQEEDYAFSKGFTARHYRRVLDFVAPNFGIAIAARMPMITTTIRSSMSVKPLRSMVNPPEMWT